jgi:hypothetical protein
MLTCSGKSFKTLGDVDAFAADMTSAIFYSISIYGGKDV